MAKAEKVKFEPIQKYKKDENNELLLDDKGNKIKVSLYTGTTLEEVYEFLNKYGTAEDKKEFATDYYTRVVKKPSGKKNKKGKEIYEPVTKDGKVLTERSETPNWLYAKRRFFEKFDPEDLGSDNKKNQLSEEIKAWMSL